MQKYVYVRLYETSPLVWATDPSVLDWIFGEVKKHVPTCAIRNEDYDLAGVRVGFTLHQLQNKELLVAKWLIRLLCDNGFEPFEVTPASDSGMLRWLHFRRAVEI